MIETKVQYAEKAEYVKRELNESFSANTLRNPNLFATANGATTHIENLPRLQHHRVIKKKRAFRKMFSNSADCEI